MKKKAVFLVGFGNPKSSSVYDIWSFLKEILSDKAIKGYLPAGRFSPKWLIGLAAFIRAIKLRKAYASLWTPTGHRQVVEAIQVTGELQKRLGDDCPVHYCSLYGEPSFDELCKKIDSEAYSKVIVIPLFPHYSYPTTSTIFEIALKRLSATTQIRFCPNFHTNQNFINLFVEAAKQYDLSSYDSICFSFHSLPLKALLYSPNYEADCKKTSLNIAKALNIPSYDVVFQSKFGKGEWLKPSLKDTIETYGRSGKKRVAVFSPSFVFSSLETLYEIASCSHNTFLAYGGKSLDFIGPSCDSSYLVNVLQELCTSCND